MLSLQRIGLSLTLGCAISALAADPGGISVSGIYPHLAMFNNEGECGIGAVVPWADRLWVITYGPHLPFGSSDKLYEITPGLEQIIRPESVGGTPADRMIHKESDQLIIGPYFIGADRSVRVMPPARMPGRLTGVARHLTAPADRVYFATMEEGLYDVDVRTLQVTGLIRDGNKPRPDFSQETDPAPVGSELPGYHGKGLYSGQGRVVYANNGDRDKRVLTDPSTPSGALAEWRGARGEDWSLVRRNQFTEVTGPGGIEGNPHPETDPVWSVGWDHRSLILMALDAGKWHAWRLPKTSHSYDGAHGWNTEWPRIRDIDEDSLLMTMHGAFWRFPRTFSAANSAGIAPRSSYLKVIGDFCRWNGRLVFGCDDTAKSEFLNKRKAKGDIEAPGQSQSNLWFVEPERIDHLGPTLGRGAVWLEDEVKADTPSDPFLFSGWPHRMLFVGQSSDAADSQSIGITIEVDHAGNGKWETLRNLDIPAGGGAWTEFKPEETGAWVRLRANRDCPSLTAFFHYRGEDGRGVDANPMFAGIAGPQSATVMRGLVRARGANKRTLALAATHADGTEGYYEMDASLTLRAVNDADAADWTRKHTAIPRDVLTVDEASILYVDDKGRWRLPKGDAAADYSAANGAERICREVCTERDLFNAGGTFYELPAENAGGFARLRPIATHNHRIHDYCSYRGLLVMTGIDEDAAANGADGHVIRSTDGEAAVWVGAVDDLWQFGKPRGAGGPWKNTAVKANTPSDPYLMTGYDRKRLTLSQHSSVPVTIRVEVDVSGTGTWSLYRSFTIEPGKEMEHQFSDAFSAYWVRVAADADCIATAWFIYE